MLRCLLPASNSFEFLKLACNMIVSKRPDSYLYTYVQDRLISEKENPQRQRSITPEVLAAKYF